MFVIDDKHPEFLTELADTFACRGVDSVSLSDYAAVKYIVVRQEVVTTFL